MLEDIEHALPEQWKGLYRFLILPVYWIVPFQEHLIDLAWNSSFGGVLILKRIFFVLPTLGLIIGIWCSMLAVYTLTFRSNRAQFVGAILIMWWDLLRNTWLFWAGMGKFLWMLFGSIWGLLRLVVGVLFEIIRECFELPFVLTGEIARNFRQPGVPWLAFLMTVGWSLLEAFIFSYILTPTVSEIVIDLVGTVNYVVVSGTLFIMLTFMIAGSFACLHVLVEAIDNKDYKTIVQMGIIEFFVMFVEVLFFYRELVDALTPWIAQQTGFRMGIIPVILLASFCWIGIRGMVWFLFGRFGTPTLLALISRQRLQEDEQATKPGAKAEERWGVVLGKIKKEQDWFQAKADALLQAAVLPIFQVIAASLNFCFVLFIGKPLFNVPFKTLSEVKETIGLLRSMREESK